MIEFISLEGVIKFVQMTRKISKSSNKDRVVHENTGNANNGKACMFGFMLLPDYFTITRQSPKTYPARLLVWQEDGRKNLKMTYVKLYGRLKTEILVGELSKASPLIGISIPFLNVKNNVIR